MQRPFTSASRRSLVVGALLVGLAAIVLLVPILELWDADLSVPIASVYEPRDDYVYSPDAPFYLMLAKGGVDHAWFLTNPTLGWPLGQQVYDLPQSLDNLNLAEIKALDLVFGDAAAAVNVFFVLTFALVAVSAFLVLRRLRVSAPTAFVVALLYTFLPYHFARGAPHLFLSSYWVVPLAIYLVLRVVSARPPFTAETEPEPGAEAEVKAEADASRDAPKRRRTFRVRLFDRSGILWLLACFAMASTGSYYAVFTVLLIAILALVDVLANRRGRVAASAGIAIVAIGLFAFVNLLPTLVYWTVEGTNSAMFRRLPYETEFEGLKVSQLFLPIENHRLAPFADTAADVARFTPVPSEKGQNLGLIGAVGLVALLGALLLAARRTRAARPTVDAVPGDALVDGDRRAPPEEAAADGDPRAPPDETTAVEIAPVEAASDGLTPGVVLRTLGILAIVCILVATVSGVSLLISGLGFRDIRAYNRIVVFIAFAALVAIAFGLDWLGRRLPDRRWRTPVVVLGLALVLVVGILDQVSPASIPDYVKTQSRWASDDAFVGRIERTLRDGSAPLADRSTTTPAVFELPYQYFPEAPDAGVMGILGPYDLVRGYLHSDGLNWSWGAVRGRGADWQLNVVQRPVDDFLDRIAAVGYSGIMLDRTAGDVGTPNGDAITGVLGEPMVSHDGELLFWDLRERAQELRDRIGARGVAELKAETLADVPKVKAQGS